MTTLQEAVDPEDLAVAARWFGGVDPVWRDGEWLCNDADTNGIVISAESGAVSVFFDVHQGKREAGPDVVCTAPQDALRFVLFRSGVKMRQRYLYPRLLVPFSPSLARPGFTVSPGDGVGASVTVDRAEGPETDRRLEFKLAGRATESTFYLGAAVEDLVESIRVPSGAPLFTDVQRVQATSPERARP